MNFISYLVSKSPLSLDYVICVHMSLHCLKSNIARRAFRARDAVHICRRLDSVPESDNGLRAGSQCL